MSNGSEMANGSEEDLIWTVRLFIYRYLVEHERPPSTAETAVGLAIDPEQAQAAYRHLHERHAILLQPDSLTIRIANPFSAVPTGFRVHVNSHAYWATCAWDAFGIAAALDSDARIEALCADSQTPTTIAIERDVVHGHGELVHVALPFRRWYDVLVHT